MRRRGSGVLWIACGAALWGTDTVLRRPLSTVLSPIQIVFYEHLILSLVVAPIIIRDRTYLKKIPPRLWLALCAIAWIGSALSTVLFTAAIRAGSPTTAVLLQKTQPLFAILLARAFLGERWPRSFPWVALIGISGAYLVAFGDGNLLRPAKSIQVSSALLALGAAAGWAFATIWGRMATAEIPFELVTALRFVLALPALLVAALLQHQTGTPSSIQLAALVWIALIPGFAGMMLYYRGLRQTPAAQAAIGELAFPATAVLLNWLVLSVPATLIQVAGFAIIWLAISRLSRMQN
jgi:drug/metabolite transporter (DMT)-like permease